MWTIHVPEATGAKSVNDAETPDGVGARKAERDQIEAARDAAKAGIKALGAKKDRPVDAVLSGEVGDGGSVVVVRLTYGVVRPGPATTRAVEREPE